MLRPCGVDFDSCLLRSWAVSKVLSTCREQAEGQEGEGEEPTPEEEEPKEMTLDEYKAKQSSVSD